MNKLKIEISAQEVKSDAVVISGKGMVHSAVYWPQESVVEELCKSFLKSFKF